MTLDPATVPARPSGRAWFVQCATVSWATVPVSILVNLLIVGAAAGPLTPELRRAQTYCSGFFILFGILGGILALCGLRRHGRKGILWPAVTGLTLWLVLGLLAWPAVAHALRRAEEMNKPAAMLRPAWHTPLAERVEDKAVGFSFDLPEGFAPVPDAKKLPMFQYTFTHTGEDGQRRFIMIKYLGGKLGRGDRLRPEQLPPGKGMSLATFSWRGLPVDGVRVPEKAGDKDFVTFNVQVPLRAQAIQVGFGGPVAAEPELRTLAGTFLRTLDGETNW